MIKGIKLATTYTSFLVLLAIAFGLAVMGVETHRLAKGPRIKPGVNASFAVTLQTFQQQSQDLQQ